MTAVVIRSFSKGTGEEENIYRTPLSTEGREEE
jgi:hypothetical protein